MHYIDQQVLCATVFFAPVKQKEVIRVTSLWNSQRDLLQKEAISPMAPIW